MGLPGTYRVVPAIRVFVTRQFTSASRLSEILNNRARLFKVSPTCTVITDQPPGGGQEAGGGGGVGDTVLEGVGRGVCETAGVTIEVAA